MKYMLKKQHSDGPLIGEYAECHQYKCVTSGEVSISIIEPDNCCAVHYERTDYIIVKNICCTKTGNIAIIGHKFLRVKPLYNKPCDSTLIGCCYVAKLSPELGVWPLDENVMKCMKLPWKNGYSIIPLLHID